MAPRQTPCKPETRAQAVSFSGHETFVFRYGWLKKALDGVIQDSHLFTSDRAMVVLGVGKNMVRSIRHWGLATRILAEEPRTRGLELKPTEIGHFLFGPSGHDPYLEDVNSLWLLHWNLATNEQRATSWCWAFNLLASGEFTRESLGSTIISELTRRNAKVPSQNSLRRDVDCLVRTYVASGGQKVVVEDSLDCPLVELDLIEDEGSGVFRFRRGPQSSLADAIFVCALVDFWQRTGPDRESLAFSDVAYGFGSPGATFKLDENSLVERLERLEQVTSGVLLYTETAGLKQVYRRGGLNASDVLERYYASSSLAVLAGV